jgi:hypothetical protein
MGGSTSIEDWKKKLPKIGAVPDLTDEVVRAVAYNEMQKQRVGRTRQSTFNPYKTLIGGV